MEFQFVAYFVCDYYLVQNHYIIRLHQVNTYWYAQQAIAVGFLLEADSGFVREHGPTERRDFGAAIRDK